VFASGLRNPQELAFDDLGNLFTGDNNSDSGDKARWVYVVEGGDSGWRMYYQYLEDRGPFNRERIWHPYRSDEETTAVQPAYIVPPIANIADGPSGLTYYPGLGLPDRYKNHFFLCDFRGNAGNSGIRSFAVKPQGASFELVDSHQFLWSILATDADFGYDGGLYATDWVEGWDGPGKGRLYRFTDPNGAQAVLAAKTQAIMKAGFDHRNVKELVELLEHPDKRIRQEAQFALVRKNAVKELTGLAKNSDKQLPRLHAIWALGQLVRQGDLKVADELSLLLAQFDLDSEVLAQSAKVFGDCVRIEKDAFRDCLQSGGSDRMQKLLAHPEPRVQFFAAQGMANIGRVADLLPLLTLLDENQDQGPMLRHAAVMGLAGIGERHPRELENLAKHSSRYGRMGVLLALRRGVIGPGCA
jgi:quinoprotein glucose dehydrogenase